METSVSPKTSELNGGDSVYPATPFAANRTLSHFQHYINSFSTRTLRCTVALLAVLLTPAVGARAERVDGVATREQRAWWAFQPLKPVTPPQTKDLNWPRNELDRFVLAGLETAGLAPSKPADKRALIRRATFDLTGLPPTPGEIDAFMHDERPDAFEKVVDRLLASPHYGERWGRHWLDVVRYADSYQKNPTEHPDSAKFELHEAYRYRDWVVAAFNRDLPYDQFIVHQIAGDLMPSPTGQSPYVDGVVATGFLSLGFWDHSDADKEKVVSDIVDDQIDVVGKAFLGLTLSCARCHDHKFDPISNEDYYALAGIFYSTRTVSALGKKDGSTHINRVPLVSGDYLAKREAQLAAIKDVEVQLAAIQRSPATTQPATTAPAADAEHQDQIQALTRRRDELNKALTPAPPMAIAVQDGGTPGGLFPGVQDVRVHVRGSYANLGPVVKRRLPTFFAGDSQPKVKGSGRIELANWVASPTNPLTARVMVNRVWQYHFGEGIVRTPSNFGKLSERPTHPELLDWLADLFIRDGWSVKKLHRRIMLSSTYQQSTTVSTDVAARDPDNRLFGRMSPRRLESEEIRDVMLAATGRLDPTFGGPATADLNVPRRSLYIATTRWDRSNVSSLFDAANPDQSVERRVASTVAPQALFFLNDPFVAAQVRQLVERLRAEAKNDNARIVRAYELLYARPPDADEIAIGLRFLAGSSWQDYAHVLLCNSEFIYVD